MRIVYKRSLTFIAILIALCGLIGVAYLFYDKVIINETIVLVDGDLSTNFIDGVKINANGDYNFSVTNNGNKDLYYEILVDEVKGYDINLKYNLISNEASINILNSTIAEDTNLLASNVLIKAGSTQNFLLTINNNSITSFELKIKKNSETEEYFFATILKNNDVKKESITKVGEEIATSFEGLIEDVDDYGIMYYFRGNAINNYVSFANKLWRIVKINGDGSVKLVLNEVSTELTNYNATLENYNNFEETTINKKLTIYYDSNLKNYDNYIEKAKFCKESEYIQKDNELIYNPYARLLTNKIPTFNCLGDKYTNKIGLLTADEIVYAGANFKDENKEYYLYNDKIENQWWTSTLANYKNEVFYPFIVSVKGEIKHDTSGVLYRGLRPVINIVKKTTVMGSGFLEDPYIIL